MLLYVAIACKWKLRSPICIKSVNSLDAQSKLSKNLEKCLSLALFYEFYISPAN